ncbi:MAG: hypothetical protein LBD74_00370 [Spirochaetaceae bacterium]|jgi:hypothetical protein|nr:hypothetical protein [Spirochaetaceae bacterium]
MTIKLRPIPLGKPALFTGLLSLGLGGCIALLVLTLRPRENPQEYAVLMVDASYADRHIGELLKSQARTPEVLSESNQWVLLDDFGTLQQIPLDAYEDRLEPFDPRNDGYAEKLRAFFVRQGKRLFFIPLSAKSPQELRAFQGSLAEALPEIPFSLTFLGRKKPFLGYFLLFAVAAGVALALSPDPALMAALLPILGALVLAGPLGFALDAAIIALTGIAADPLRKRWAAHRYGQEAGEAREVAKSPDKVYPALAALFTGAALLAAVLGILYARSLAAKSGGQLLGKNLIPLGMASVACCALMIARVLWLETNQGKAQNHVRFMPVRIMESASGGPVNRTVLPFALAVLIALYGPWLYEGPHAAEDRGLITDPQYLLDERNYEAHARYQASFSLLPLQASMAMDYPRELGAWPYHSYRVGEDGFITQEEVSEDLEPPPATPPFPLAELVAFLEGFSYTPEGVPSHITMLTVTALTIGGFLVFLMAPGLYSTVLSAFKQTGKKRNRVIYNEKRIAA